MRYLVIGSGGREHTIAWRLLNDKSADQVFLLPGNGGVDPHFCININPKDHKSVIGFCKKNNIDLVVVGPEAPLVDGLVDSLNQADIPTFGPSGRAAMLEGSKLYAKQIMEKYNVPTAEYHILSGKKAILEFIDKNEKYPLVIKLDGLAAGKGVGIPQNKEEAFDFISQNINDKTKVFIEEYLDGEEASVLGISDGYNIFPLVAAQDHKRIFDGDKGLNTGGMGAYAPAPIITEAMMQRVQKEVLDPVVKGMQQEGTPFKGVLYAGLMIKGQDIKVLEFNVRFGDPEAQVILPLLKGKLGDIFISSIKGGLRVEMLKCTDQHAITVVLASGGYPGAYEKDKVITGLENVSKDGIVFHAGTRREGDEILTDGGRVLAVTALADDLVSAKDKVYNEIKKISFEKSFYRKDIGHRAFK